MASSAATLKIRSVLNLKLLSTLALSTLPSRSNDTIMSTMRVSLPAAPIGGSQHFDKCARNRSISDNPSGPTTGLSGAFKTSPAAALRLSFSFSAAFLRSCSRRFLSASSFTALAFAKFCITPVSASVRCLASSFCRASLFTRFGGDFGSFFGIFCAAVCTGFGFGGTGGCASAGFGFSIIFSGMISAAGSTAFGVGLAGVLGAAGAAFGGGGGGDGGILRCTACCSCLAVLTSLPSFTLVCGTVCTISIITSGWSSGSGRFKDGRPTNASTTMPRCKAIEM